MNFYVFLKLQTLQPKHIKNSRFYKIPKLYTQKNEISFIIHV